MGKKLTKKEREQRAVEYRIAWIDGYNRGLNAGQDEYRKMICCLIELMDSKVVDKVQKAVKGLEPQMKVGGTKGDVFVKHIEKHLKGDGEVICTICDKSVDAIYKERLDKIREGFE